MSDSLLNTTRRVRKEGGMKAAASLAIRKVLSPVARVGSLYFLQRDLSMPMPPLKPVEGIVVREATLQDIHLLDSVENAAVRKEQASERLQRGDLWFVGIEKKTGRLTNYRWASLTSGFIPELNRELILNPGEAYVYDLETLPQFRRRGIESLTRQYSYSRLFQRYGIHRIIVYVLAENHASLQAGRQYLTPIVRAFYVQFRSKVYAFVPRSLEMPRLELPLEGSAHAEFRARNSSSLR
jgi:ribosomal protein S18 acetylase RimI-like enzyme